MISFKDLNIKAEMKGFAGKKITATDILNIEITVLDWKVEKSIIKPELGKKCLHLSLEHEGKQRVMFCSGTFLIKQLEQIPKDKFPFKATIRKIQDWYEFT